MFAIVFLTSSNAFSLLNTLSKISGGGGVYTERDIGGDDEAGVLL